MNMNYDGALRWMAWWRPTADDLRDDKDGTYANMGWAWDERKMSKSGGTLPDGGNLTTIEHPWTHVTERERRDALKEE